MAASTSSRSGLFSLFKPYQAWLMLLMALTVLTNGLNLLLPRLIERGIDDYATRPEHLGEILWPFAAVSVAILVFTLIQNLVQALTAEWVARDLRGQLVEKLSQQPYPTLQELGAATLLTRLTSDVDAIKLFVSQVLVAMVSSLLLIVGASGLLLWMHWQLALGVLLTLPLIGFGFRLIFGPARELFGRSQGVVDQLNRVINESILGAALVRVLHSAGAAQISTAQYRGAHNWFPHFGDVCQFDSDDQFCRGPGQPDYFIIGRAFCNGRKPHPGRISGL
jgi:ATP-binding cassette subfamily B protein